MTIQNNLGINTVHFSVKKIEALGLGRAEVCRGRGVNDLVIEAKAVEEVIYLSTHGIPFGIHLPLWVPEWFQADYLSAFYLDPDPLMRALSWKLLIHNLERLSDYPVEYGVVHFCGVYPDLKTDGLDARLESALDQLAELSEKYQLPLRIEYFGSNNGWWDYSDWIRRLKNYSPLGLVTDTGHLHFSALKHGFDFDVALETLMPFSDSFHLWTVLGDGFYGGSLSYRDYHHIPVSIEQRKSLGWAFDAETVVNHLAQTQKPVIIESSPKYGGGEYYCQSIQWLKNQFLL